MSEQAKNVLLFPQPKKPEEQENSQKTVSVPDKLLKSKPDSLLKTGLVSRVHGIRGELFIRPFNEEFQWPKNLKQVFLNGMPFSVKSCLAHTQGLRFLFHGVNTRDEARTLVGNTVSISKSLFKKKEGEFYLFELMDFEVHVRGKGKIGHIKQFSCNKGQDILLIQKTNQQEIPVPFVEEYIESIHFQEKRISLNLPGEFPGIFDAG